MRRQLSHMALMGNLTGWCQGEHQSGTLENLPHLLMQMNSRMNDGQHVLANGCSF